MDVGKVLIQCHVVRYAGQDVGLTEHSGKAGFDTSRMTQTRTDADIGEIIFRRHSGSGVTNLAHLRHVLRTVLVSHSFSTYGLLGEPAGRRRFCRSA